MPHIVLAILRSSLADVERSQYHGNGMRRAQVWRRIARARTTKNTVGRGIAQGRMKQQMLLEKFMDARGIKRAERHVLTIYISLLAVTLC
jgi:hypothetical protein